MIDKWIISVIVVFASSTFILGQTCCTGGTPNVGIINTTSLKYGQFKGVLTFDNNSIDDIVLGKQRAGNVEHERNVTSTNLQLEYGLPQNLTIGLLLPYVVKTERTSSTSTETSGLGDITFFISRVDTLVTRWNYQTYIGIKSPSGKTKVTINGLMLPPSLQIGTGSYDFNFIFGLTGYPFKSLDLMTNALINYTWNRNGSLAYHDEFSFGSELRILINHQYSVPTTVGIFGISAGIEWRMAGANKIESITDSNSGGRWSYLLMSTSYSPGKSLSFFGGVDLPFYQNLNGLQLSTDLRFRVGLSKIIDFSENDLFDDLE